MDIIITSPSLNPQENVSGISTVTSFIIRNNTAQHYLHFQLGRKDSERGGWHRGLALVRRYQCWKDLLRTHPQALIHYNFPLSKASLLRDPWFMGYALRHRRKMVVHVHGGFFLMAQRIPKLPRLILKWVFRHDVPFIVLSENEKHILESRFGARSVSVLPNAVDLKDAEKYAQEPTDEAGQKNLRIGYLGRIEPNKGMTELLGACVKLAGRGCDFSLVLAGKEQTSGEYLPRFEQALGRHFEYAGLVFGEAKCRFLRSLDLFILPSYFEGLPMSLLECMSYGVTPVVTPVGSIPNVVENGVNGIFIRHHDEDSIVEAILRLDKDRVLLHALGKEARQTILNGFSPQSYVKTLNRIYNLA